MSDDISIEFDEIKHQTENAYLFIIDGDEHWFPKSQVRIYETNNKFYAPKWLAKQKGLL